MKEQPKEVAAAWARYRATRKKLCEKAWKMVLDGKSKTLKEAAEKQGLYRTEFYKWVARHHGGEIYDIYKERYPTKYSGDPRTPKRYLK